MKFPEISFLVSIKATTPDTESTIRKIINQNRISNFEVILYIEKNPTALSIANSYQDKNKNKISIITSNHRQKNKNILRRMLQVATATYYYVIDDHQEIDFSEIFDAIKEHKHNHLFSHPKVKTTWETSRSPQPYLKKQKPPYPLVSVCIYNYNYGRYLEQCLDSVLNQDYPNIEICFSDNSSSDHSWSIAEQRLHSNSEKNRIITAIRNRENFGGEINLANCLNFTQGKYLLILCSDDAIKPGLISTCVSLLESNINSGFIMVHRDIIDENGKVKTEPPFYNQSCIIPGEEQTAVYMMAAVNLTLSQIVYRRELFLDKRSPSPTFTHRWFANRIQDFRICLKSSMIYVDKAFVLHREHEKSDSADIDSNLMQGIGQFALVHQFSEMASSFCHESAKSRLPAAIRKVAQICLRFCARYLLRDNSTTALRYLHLAQAINPNIESEEEFKQLNKFWTQPAERAQTLIEIEASTELLFRKSSYPIPPNSTPLFAVTDETTKIM